MQNMHGVEFSIVSQSCKWDNATEDKEIVSEIAYHSRPPRHTQVIASATYIWDVVVHKIPPMQNMHGAEFNIVSLSCKWDNAIEDKEFLSDIS